MLGAEHEAQIRQHDQRDAVQELDALIARVGPKKSGDDRVREPQADCAADHGAQDARDRGFAQPALEEDDEGREDQPEGEVRYRADRQREKNGGGIRNDGDEDDTRKREPSHW